MSHPVASTDLDSALADERRDLIRSRMIEVLDEQQRSLENSRTADEACEASRVAPIDLAYQEYCRRVDAGEKIDPVDFCGREFPALTEDLLKVIALRAFISGMGPFSPSMLNGTGASATVIQSGEGKATIAWPELNAKFLGFTLVAELGRGSFARVYLAREAHLGDRLVVVKASSWELGSHEAQTLGKLAHPNIVPVYSIKKDVASGLTAICMPYLGSATFQDVIACRRHEGRAATIEAALRAASLPEVPHQVEPADSFLARASYVDGIVHIVSQLADALAFVHGSGVLHRDLKPSNVLLSPGGRPRVLDFNLSADDAPGHPFGGTPAYMSPEQIQVLLKQGKKVADLDGRSDVFALGVLLYEALSGRHPFAPLPVTGPMADVAAAMQQRHRHAPPPLRESCPEAVGRLEALVHRCLSLDPAVRPQSAAELAGALRATISPFARLRRRTARYRMAAFALLLFAAPLAIYGASAIVTRPAFHLQQYEQGLKAYEAKEYGKAVDCFQAALAAGYDRAQALFARGRAFQQLGRHEQALGAYRDSRELLPDPRTTACIAFCDGALGHHGPAIKFCDEALDAGLVTAAILNNKGCSCVQLALVAEQEEAALTKAIELDPSMQAAYRNRALLYLQRAVAKRKDGNYLPAIRDMQKAVTLGPRSGQLLYEASWCCARQPGWSNQALNYLQQAIALGIDPKQASREYSFKELKSDARFAKVLSQPATPGAGPRNTPRFVDPVVGVPILRRQAS
jgi:eukaryotic-like serine/threonine-protein kinase